MFGGLWRKAIRYFARPETPARVGGGSRVYILQGGSGKLVNIHEGTHPSLAGTWLAGTLSEGL